MPTFPTHHHCAPLRQCTSTAHHFANAPKPRAAVPVAQPRTCRTHRTSQTLNLRHSGPDSQPPITTPPRPRHTHSLRHPNKAVRSGTPPQRSDKRTVTDTLENGPNISVDQETPTLRRFDRYKVFLPICFHQFPLQMHAYFLYPPPRSGNPHRSSFHALRLTTSMQAHVAQVHTSLCLQFLSMPAPSGTMSTVLTICRSATFALAFRPLFGHFPSLDHDRTESYSSPFAAFGYSHATCSCR